ncbi:MAG: hypothetical protein H6933_13530 [Burkholderiaceae bacterium]|nr:hypothetical protein [Rhodoferax sp.]MCP5285908.1 hypothetical protein [Burkholderiaceae bacterium]
MKYLLVLAVVVGVLWLMWRPRARPPSPSDRAARGTGRPAEMIACAHCDLRLPRNEALFDPKGQAYCCAEHRRSGAR